LQYRQILIQYAAVDEILARKIDIDASGIVSLVLPVAKNAAGFVEYPIADFDDLPGSFGNPDKVSWIDIFTILLRPADQRLARLDRTGVKIDLGLKMKPQTILLEGFAQVGFNPLRVL